MATVKEALLKLEGHERECAVRYSNIERRLDEGQVKFKSLQTALWGIYPLIITLFVMGKFFLVMDINENSNVTIPIRNLIAMVAATAIATTAYFGIQERLKTLEHSLDKSQAEIERNTEFRILWPRGELGSLPDDARQDMLIQGIQLDVEDLRGLQSQIHDLTVRLGTMEALNEQENDND